MGRFTRYDFVACDNGLRQAHDMIYDCFVRQKKCRSILKHVLKRCDNRKSCRRPVVSLSHATKSYRVNRPYGCPEKIISITKCFYNNFSCSVIHRKKLTDWFSVRSGVRQGCVLSPMLFLIAIDWIMHKKTIGNKRRGIRWTLTSLLEDLDFADDVALVSSTRGQLQRKTSDLSLAASQLGLNISRKKTKTIQLTETLKE